MVVAILLTNAEAETAQTATRALMHQSFFSVTSALCDFNLKIGQQAYVVNK